MKHMISLTSEELSLLQTSLLAFKITQSEAVQNIVSSLELNIISQIRSPLSESLKDYTDPNPQYNLTDTLK